jgi:hypothetical protein
LPFDLLVLIVSEGDGNGRQGWEGLFLKSWDFWRVESEHGELVEGLLQVKLTCIVLDEVPVVLSGFHWVMIIN